MQLPQLHHREVVKMVGIFTWPTPNLHTWQAPERGACRHLRGPDVTHPGIDELLGTIAHELRSPLATILSAVQVITYDCEIDAEARRALAVVERQSQQAMRIVEDLFDLCSGASGKLSLRNEMVDLADIVALASETAAHLLAARQHRLTVSLPPEPVILDADALRLQQVLTNLLGNAAKFTDPGGHIRLTAEVEAGQIVLRVRDNGRGIAPDLLPRVFDLFRQGPDHGDGQLGGLGIGLAVVKSLVELHGGSVAAFSEGPGTGSEFVVRLPARAHDAV
jgi:signal transduction histidine kinase